MAPVSVPAYPRAPRRLSWAIAGRLARGVAVAFMLVWLVALVAWPERQDLRARYVQEQRGVIAHVVSKAGFCWEDGTWQWGAYHFWNVRELLESLPPGRYWWETTTQTSFPTPLPRLVEVTLGLLA